MKSTTLFELPPYLPEAFVSNFENKTDFGPILKWAVQLLWANERPGGKPEIYTVIFSGN